jgi:hypothetical protein
MISFDYICEEHQFSWEKKNCGTPETCCKPSCHTFTLPHNSRLAVKTGRPVLVETLARLSPSVRGRRFLGRIP